jgi:hypothetical protein
MKINTTFLIVGLFLIVLLSSVVVAKSDNPSLISAKNNDSLEKNATFGQCVSENADIKNICYATVKDRKELCKSEASNQTDSKPALKNCASEYKKDKKQCKIDFKSSKKECAKIKHNFFDRLK